MCWVKYGIDPRTDIKYRIYQFVDLRTNDPTVTGTNYVFDGKTKVGTKYFQMVDIIDPDFEKLIKSLAFCRAVCDISKDGWYVEGHMVTIRDLMKKKLNQMGHLMEQVDAVTQEDTEMDHGDVKESDHRYQQLLDDLLVDDY